MTFTQLLPYLLPTAIVFALTGWMLGRKKATPAAAVASTPAAKSATPSNSERQRLRDLEAKLRASDAAAAAAAEQIKTLTHSSVPKAQHDALAAELETARTNASALEVQLRKSKEVQASLQSQANEAGKKIQARAITLENELSTARTEIQRLLALSAPNTDGMKRLEGEIETVRTRLRAVEAQLAERNAELSVMKASALATTARAPRTIAPRDTTPGASLDLLGFDLTPAPAPAAAEPAAESPKPAAAPIAAPAPTPSAAPVEAPAPAPAPGLAPDPAPAAAAVVVEDAPASPAVTVPSGADTALSSATAIMGKAITPDDLTLIEGIGPKISELLTTAGIGTWESLAQADPDHLQTILAAAGPAYAIHHPGTWPEQARLAADAKWFQLRALKEKLEAGQPPQTALV
jgi:predicted flap endonuclease-1-like 5' DNA nuclease